MEFSSFLIVLLVFYSDTRVITEVDGTTVTPSFRVNNTDGDACMLLEFNAIIKVNYKNSSGDSRETTIPVTNTTSFEERCTSVLELVVYYPDKASWCVGFGIYFEVTGSTTYTSTQYLQVRYNKPCFPPDALNYNNPDAEEIQIYGKSFGGTIGKSMRCNSIELQDDKTPNLEVIMTDILFQPFAQNSSVPGDFGEEENCTKTMPTTKMPTTKMPTTKMPATIDDNTTDNPVTMPSGSSKVGMIVGILIGVLAAVAIVNAELLCA